MSRLAPIPRPVIDSSTGKALANAKIYTYGTGTTNNKATYPTRADAIAGTNANTNPVTTDNYGYPSTEIWLLNDAAYTITIKTSDDATTIWTADEITGVSDNSFKDTEVIKDDSGNEYLKFSKTASAINELTIANASTGNGPTISATGGDTDIDINLTPKGSGTVVLGGGTTFSDTITVTHEDTRTNSIKTLADFTSTTTGTPANGIGTGIRLSAESGDENPAQIGALNFSFDDITAGSEDSAFVVQLRTAGAGLANKYIFRNTGTSSYVITGAPSSSRTITLPDHSLSKYYVQHVSDTLATFSTNATTMPADDTIPQISEGSQLLSATITPSATSNILIIEAELWIGHSSIGATTHALFQDSTADALAANTYYHSTANAPSIITLRHRMTAGTTSATTFRIRAGGVTGSLLINGTNSARILGGVGKCILTVTEYTA